MVRTLVIEPIAALSEVISSLLTTKEHKVVIINHFSKVLETIKSGEFDLILCDYPLKEVITTEFVETVKEHPSSPKLVFMSAFTNVEEAVDLMKRGAHDVLIKPFLPDNLIERVNSLFPLQPARKESSDALLHSQSAAMSTTIEDAIRLAPFQSSVLITGESGTGKEVLARFIHSKSARTSQPFIPLNCAAIPHELLESELFGHELGAFTGAVHTHIGVFERASQGTLFLDEIGDMPLALQVKLLRALQEKEIMRVGGSRTIKVQPRIVAATNQNLHVALRNGSFREDLYYRLAAVELTLPPLRERRDDIPLLARHLLTRICKRYSLISKNFQDEVTEYLKSLDWPGNIRQLEHAIERAVIFSQHEIKREHFEDRGRQKQILSLSEEVDCAVREAERRAISQALVATNYHKKNAAILLGVSYKTLLAKTRHYSL
jgi:DNA-binding NtrC family response regulator